MQIHEEARKFAYQTGVKVVVAYGGAPINQQVCISCDCMFFCIKFVVNVSMLLETKGKIWIKGEINGAIGL